jgi:hypothetical protein
MDVIKGVYVLTNKINGKRYVGIGMSKSGIQGRWKKYKNYNCKQQIKLYNALKLYGVDNFTFEVVLETGDIDNAKRSEMYLIDVWNLQEDGYNMTAGGDGCNGLKHSDETKQKLREISKNMSEETKKKIGDAHRGRKQCEEHIRNGVEARKGYKHSEETKQKIGKSNKGSVSWNKGGICSEETKLKMSKSQKGKEKSEEHKRKIGESQKGRVPWNKGLRKK